MASVDIHRRDNLLIRLRNVWSDLTQEEQSAVEVLINSIASNHGRIEAGNGLYAPLSETELFARINRSLAEAEAGDYEDAEAFEAELSAELDLL